MAQIVIEFGAPTLGTIMDATLSVIGTPTVIEIELRSGGGQVFAMDYLETLSRQLTDGQVLSATFRTESKEVRYGLIIRPHYGGQNRSIWMGTVELVTTEWRPYWEALLQFDGLSFVCVGDEEGVELTDDNLTVTSFPWDEWPLLVGALRAEEEGNSWVIRERTPE